MKYKSITYYDPSGKHYRTDGPSKVVFDEDYFLRFERHTKVSGSRHREDGPAIIYISYKRPLGSWAEWYDYGVLISHRAGNDLNFQESIQPPEWFIDEYPENFDPDKTYTVKDWVPREYWNLLPL